MFCVSGILFNHESPRRGKEFVTRKISDWEKFVVIDKRLFRPAEVDYLKGNPEKAMKKLGWKPAVAFRELVALMVDADIERLRNE